MGLRVLPRVRRGRRDREVARACEAQLGDEFARRSGYSPILGDGADRRAAAGPGWEGLGDLVAKAAALASTAVSGLDDDGQRSVERVAAGAAFGSPAPPTPPMAPRGCRIAPPVYRLEFVAPPRPRERLGRDEGAARESATTTDGINRAASADGLASP